MTDDPLKRLYRSLRAHVTEGVAGDVMQMPPSWGEILTAVHEAAFPDDATVTSASEAAKRIQYAEGWDAGYGEGHAAGYREAVLRFVGGEPEPEPEPLTASEALQRAHMRADEDSPESSILWAAHLYAEMNPEWFQHWRECDDPSDALESAQNFAHADVDMTAWGVLSAAKRVAADNPDLFGGEA